jgi:hypothetical protein
MLTHLTRLERFLIDHSLTLLRLERLNGERARIVVQHDGRDLAVSFASRRPTRVALKKLDHAIQERRT